MENRQIAALATQLGHAAINIRETPASRRWIVECTCGWGALDSGGRPTLTRATFREAVTTGQWHLRKVVEDHLGELRRNGRVASFATAVGL